MSRLQINPPVATLYPNDRQVFTVQALPPPAMWRSVTDSGDIGDDFALEVDPAGSTTSGGGGHVLASGIGIVEITINDQCRPTAGNQLVINGFITDVNGLGYFYSLKINSTTVEVRDEANNQIFSEFYTAVSGDVYRLELAAGFRFYRNGVLKHSRVNLGTTVVYPMTYQCAITENTAAAPTRIPAPRLIGDWRLGSVDWTAPSHGSLTTVGPSASTEYFGGTIPGVYTVTARIEAAADNGANQLSTATITIPPLQPLGSTTVRMQPGEKKRFKTNYDSAQTSLVTWSVIAGPGSFSQDEFTAGTAPGTSIIRATASVNGLSADITVIVEAVITNASGFTAAKASEQIDFDTNLQLAPTFVSGGIKAEGIGNIIPGLPPGLQPDDIMLLFVETANQTVSTPAGWSVMADSPQGTGTGGGVAATRLDVFWKRATPAEVAPTVTDPGDHAIGQILAFRGCINTGNPYDVTSGNTGASSTSVSIPGDTTTVANCLIVLAVSNITDTATPQTSGYTNADLANLTERTDINTTQGNGGGFAVITGEKASIGAYGTTTATLANASEQGRISIALKPPIPTWTASIGSINSTSGIWTAPSQTGQTARIVVSSGTYNITLEVPVLESFPIADPTAPITVDLNKTVLVSTSEDRTRTSRVKDKGGLASQSREVNYRNKQVSELEQAIDCWQRNHPGTRLIFEDKIRNKRIVAYFDSNLRWEADNACSIDISFRIKEA